MTNGECPTWFVFGWLEKHPTHDASAPETSTRNLSTAVCVGGCVEIDTGETQGDNARIKPRSDWTIYNEHGEPVEFKRKPRVIDTGVPVNRDDLICVCSRNSEHVFARIVVTGEGGTILIRKRKT